MAKKIKKFWNDMGYSSSKWETSYYGGYYNLINDHPSIQISYQVDINVTKSMGLSWWTSDKLLKMFLLKAKEKGLHIKLAQEAKPEKIVKFFSTKEVLLVQRQSIEDVLDEICETELEHKALFKHYEELILTSEISIPLPPPPSRGGKKGKDEKNKDNKDKAKDGSGEGEGENEEGEGEGEDKGSGKKGENKNNKGEDSSGGGSDKEGEDNENEEETSESGKNENDKDGDPVNGSPSRGKDDGTRNPERGEGPMENHASQREEEIKRKKGDLEDFLGEIKKREIVSHHLNGNLVKQTRFIHPRDRNKCRFTDNEYSYASRLVKLLDINFDPKSDRINSLRMGKLDPRKVAEVIPGNMNVYYTHEENQSTKPFSVVILQDESGSMSEHYKIDYSKSILKILYLAFSEILPQDKIYVYGHSGDITPDVFVYQDKYNQKFEERIEAIDARDQNYDGPAIEAVYDKVRSMTDDNIIFITLSDGQPCGDRYGGTDAIKSMKKVMEKCRRDGFVTVGLGVLHFNDPDIYNYSCVIKSLGDEMIKKTSHIINKVVKTEFQ